MGSTCRVSQSHEHSRISRSSLRPSSAFRQAFTNSFFVSVARATREKVHDWSAHHLMEKDDCLLELASLPFREGIRLDSLDFQLAAELAANRNDALKLLGELVQPVQFDPTIEPQNKTISLSATR